MLIGMLVITYVFAPVSNLLTAAAFLLINGIILFASGRMMQGNKDVRSMTYLDSLLMGAVASLSAFSGVSRVGCVTSVAIARGADRQNSLNWAFLISIPALLLLMAIDVVQIFAGGVAINFWGSFFTYLLSAGAAYLGGLYSIKFMKFLTVRVGFSGFSYYCWGASLFSFLLYLTVA
jgi:undecaprenyl-diphosphatase